MCGINGFNFVDREIIDRMNTVTNHRGPDATGVWIGDTVSFGHNRLSIIDLSPRGTQPMWDARHEVVIVFNGEIYNYKELRSVLENEFKFNSDSDTEVILNAYKKYGTDCLEKLNGIFAFAIYDTRSDQLFFARDRAGVKQFYYYFDGDRFIFSSEIKAILEHNIPRAVNKEAFNIFFQILYIPEPITMFESIKKLPSAHFGILKNKSLEIHQYWNSTNNQTVGSYDETVEEIKTLFCDSVRRQMISDRPVGVFLSGGLDSTAVLGAAVEAASGSIRTFSVSFSDSKAEKFNADADLAKMTAAFYGTEHTELMVGPRDVWNNILNIVWHLDEPNFNATSSAIYLLSHEAKQSVAVVLGGDGADELFGGYPRYYYSRLFGPFLRNERRVLRFLSQKDSHLSKIISHDVYKPSAAASNFHARYFSNKKMVFSDFENYFMKIDREGWLTDESLMRTDKMSMAAGLELRVPILDHRLIELAEKIPEHWKFNLLQNPKSFQGKKIWKDAVRHYLPDHVLNQKKRGWFTPMSNWLRHDLRGPVYEVLLRAQANTNFFNSSGIEEMWQSHLTGAVYNLNSIWAIVMWQLWYEKFITKSDR